MKAKTYSLETFGCQMNVLDSQLIEGELRAMGLSPVDASEQADVILYNTCSVRQHAEDKVLSRLGRVKFVKQRKPHVIIGVIGCMAERMRDALLVGYPQVDLLCGPGELNRLPGLLRDVWKRHEQVMALAGTESRRTNLLKRAFEYDSLEQLDMSRRPDPRAGVLQSYVRVQRGCDKFCTYCVVPFVRGKERCRPPAHIVEECRRLAEAGTREITLLGQTVNSYAYEDDGRVFRLAQLLEEVHAIEGIDRIRFVTSYPADWDDDIFRVMRDYPRVCPYLHIPAQSGSDRMLKAMKRGYTAAEYLKLMDRARNIVPDIALAGDFIVGFSGETEEDFQQSVALVQRVQYKSIFVFKYSPRPGTAADRALADNVPENVKVRRNNDLLAAQSEIAGPQKQTLIGQTVAVLVEGYSKAARKVQADGNGDGAPEQTQHDPDTPGIRASANQLIGRTPHDLITVFDGPADLIGALVNIKVESASPLTLFGRVQDVVSPARVVAD